MRGIEWGRGGQGETAQGVGEGGGEDAEILLPGDVAVVGDVLLGTSVVVRRAEAL